MSTQSARVPSLDGLRAVCILMVLIGHLNGTRGFVQVRSQIGDYAHLGVVVFFIISGFLITRLMVAESKKYGSVSLKLFYARRAIRLFPAAYVFLGCVFLMGMAGAFRLSEGDVWHSLTYTVNFDAHRSWPIGHLWSLSVEEQFYFLWPSAFVLLGARRSGWAAAAAIVVAPAARLGAIVFLKGTPYVDLEMFPMVMDSIAFGCLLALSNEWLETKAWYLRLFRPSYSLAILSVVLGLNHYMGYGVDRALGATLVDLGIVILVHRSVYCSRGVTGKILNWRPLAFVGVLSYSLYVWQQIFIDRHSGAWINAFPQNLVFSVLAALSSYFMLEQPLIRLRSRLRRGSAVRQVSVPAD